jgi:DinB superfamily
MSSTSVGLLLHSLDEGYNRKAWHGTNLRGSLRGLTAKQALWRPAPGRHNIWEIAVHAAYWKYAVRQRIIGGKRGSFPRKGSNWFPRSGALKDRDWRNDLAMLENEHNALRDCIRRLPPTIVRRKLSKSKTTVLTLVAGIAAHDVYHAGQIQLLKRLMR